MKISSLLSSALAGWTHTSHREQCHSCQLQKTLKITKKTVRSPPLHGCLSLSVRSRGCTADDAQRLARSLHKLPVFDVGCQDSELFSLSLSLKHSNKYRGGDGAIPWHVFELYPRDIYKILNEHLTDHNTKNWLNGFWLTLLTDLTQINPLP